MHVVVACVMINKRRNTVGCRCQEKEREEEEEEANCHSISNKTQTTTMVQSDVLRGTTKSGKVNARWYLQRLRASAVNHHQSSADFSRLANMNSQNESMIRVVRGSTATQGQHIPRVTFKSPSPLFEVLPPKSSYSTRLTSSSMKITSATSILSSTTTMKRSSISSNSVVNSAKPSSKGVIDDTNEALSDHRSSSGTLLSVKVDPIARPPSTPVDPRCDRAYSSSSSAVARETCHLLGPELCSDCIEVQTQSNLAAERLPASLIRTRLSALAVRRFLKNEDKLTDDDLLKLINNQQIQLKSNPDNLPKDPSIMSDDEYFDRLASSLNEQQQLTPFYFKDLADFAHKYRTNTYDRLLLSDTPAPTSANPIFVQSSFDKFDISPKYAYMKRASTLKPNLVSHAAMFISPRKSQQFYAEHRYLVNYSPPLLLQTLQQTTRANSKAQLPILPNTDLARPPRNRSQSLIASRFHQGQTVNV